MDKGEFNATYLCCACGGGDNGDTDETIRSGHCEHIGWEENSSGRREWCEDKCMKAGGKMLVEDTDRGTTKESCSNYNEDGNAAANKCAFVITHYGSEMCDTECQPFGGVWDQENETCDWTDENSEVGKCNPKLREQIEEMSIERCNTTCAPTGIPSINEETQ